MNITVFGCGYVGLTTALGLSELGHKVIGVDIDGEKIEALINGKVPFFEPDLQKCLRRNKVTFTTDAKKGITESEIIFCAVSGKSDLEAVLKVAESFRKYGKTGKIFINKSTVPVGTSEQIRKKVGKKFNYNVVSNPEFLRQGSALKDFLQPDRIVIGLERDDDRLKKKIKKLYGKIDAPIVFTDLRNAEIIKYASNAFLATKVSFVNELANFCDEIGGDISEVVKGISLDKRIGKEFLQAGIGFGGSCLPRDLNVLIQTGKNNSYNFRLLKATKKINVEQTQRLLKRMRKVFPKLQGKNVAVWGITYKPNTDDLRDAPALKIINDLKKSKAKVNIYDPAANPENAYDILKNADCLMVLTEWDQFRKADLKKVKSLMRRPIVFDGRNIYDPQQMKKMGFKYYSIGRNLR